MRASRPGRTLAASSVPPPPIELPMTACRDGSTRGPAVGSAMAWSIAASSGRPREGAPSSSVFVSIVMTTNPCEASRGPSQAIFDWLAPKPGETATIPNRPEEVDLGYQIVPPPKPSASRRAIVLDVTANGPRVASMLAWVGRGPRRCGCSAAMLGWATEPTVSAAPARPVAIMRVSLMLVPSMVPDRTIATTASGTADDAPETSRSTRTTADPC